MVQDQLYLRVSAWVYNEPADYVRLAEAVERASAMPERADARAEAEAAASAESNRLACLFSGAGAVNMNRVPG